MKKKYKLAHRKGRNIEVCFDFAPNTWMSTGTRDEEEALAFVVEKLKGQEKKQETLLADYLEELILSNFAKLQKRDLLLGKKTKDTHYKELSYISRVYLLPLFGRFILQRLQVKTIEDALFDLQESNLTRNRIISTLRAIYNLAIQESLTDVSPVDRIQPFSYEPKEKEIFTREELEILFQEKNFTNLEWFLYFLILKDTGWRPGEVASLTFQDINKTGGLSTTSSVFYTGKEAKLQNKIKTSTKGQDYKIGILSPLALKVFNLVAVNKNRNDFIFKFDNKFLLTQKANRELAKAFKRANLELNGRTQYSFRHTFNTMHYYVLDDKTRHELMGHTKERKEYLHIKVNERLKHLQDSNLINF